MHKGDAFKILNIYTFTSKSLCRYSYPKVIYDTYVWTHSFRVLYLVKMHWVEHPKKIEKKQPTLAEKSNCLRVTEGPKSFGEDLIYGMDSANCLKTSTMLGTIFGSPKIYCRKKC